MSPSSTDREGRRITLPDPEKINDLPVTVMAQDVVPTVDEAEPVATYPDWRKEDTVVLTYRIGNDIYPGKFAETREEAKADATLIHGRVLEENYVQGRAFFRVLKVKKQ